MGTLPREKKLASLEGSSIHALNCGLAGVRPVDELDPFHRRGVMLVRIRCRDKLLGRLDTIKYKGVNRLSATHPKAY